MEIFKLFGSIFIDNDPANRKLQETDERAAKVGSTLAAGIRTAARWGAGIAAAAGAAMGALIALANRTAQASEQLVVNAQRAGTTTTAFQEMHYALTQVGVAESDVSMALQRLNQRVGQAEEGSSKYSQALDRLNVSARNANGEIKTSDELFMDLITRLHDVEDSQTRAALAADIFGVNLAQRILPAIEAGGEELARLRNRAHELGIVMAEENVKAGASFAGIMGELQLVISSVGQQIMARFMPTLERWVGWTAEHVPKVGAVFEFVVEVIEIIFRYMRLIIGDAIAWMRGHAIDPFVNWLSNIWQERGPPIVAAVEALWDGVKAVFGAVFDVLRGLWDTFILAFEGDWRGAWENLLETFANLWNAIPDLFTGIWDPLVGIVDGIMQAVVDVIRQVFGDDIADHFSNIWDAVLIVFELFRVAFLGVWRALSAVFRGEWSEAWDEVKDIFVRIWNALPDIVTGVLDGVFGIVNTLVGNIIGIIREVFGDQAANVFQTAWDAITIIFETAKDTILNILSVLTSLFRAEWSEAWDGVKNIFTRAWEGLTELYQGPLNGVIRWLHGWVLRVRDWFGAMRDLVARSVQGMVQDIVEWFSESKLGSAFSWLREMVEGATGWFYDMYDKVVGNSYVPDMVEEIGEAIERLRDRLANPVARYTAAAIGSFADMEDEVAASMMRMAEAMDRVLDDMVNRIARFITETTGMFFQGTATWAGVLDSFANAIGGIFNTLFDALTKEIVKSIVAQNQWLVATLANIATTVTAFLGQAYAALVGFFWFLGPGAPVAAAGVIATAIAGIASIAGQLVRGVLPSAPSGGTPDGGTPDVGGGGGSSPRGGRQVSEITGPTRDLLTDLLTPLTSLNTLTGIGERIYDLLDTRLAPPGMALAGAGAMVAAGGGGPTIIIERGAMQINSPSGTYDLDDDTIDDIMQRLAERINFELRGTGSD